MPASAKAVTSSGRASAAAVAVNEARCWVQWLLLDVLAPRVRRGSAPIRRGAVVFLVLLVVSFIVRALRGQSVV